MKAMYVVVKKHKPNALTRPYPAYELGVCPTKKNIRFMNERVVDDPKVDEGIVELPTDIVEEWANITGRLRHLMKKIQDMEFAEYFVEDAYHWE